MNRVRACLAAQSFDQAESLCLELLKGLEQIAAPSRVQHSLKAQALQELGAICMQLNRPAQALEAWELSAGIWETLELGAELAHAVEQMSALYLRENRLDDAIEGFRRAAQLRMRDGAGTQAALDWLDLAICLAEAGEHRAAIRHITQGLHQIQEQDGWSNRISARRKAAEAYKAMGKESEYLEHLEILSHLQTRWNEELQSATASLTAGTQAHASGQNPGMMSYDEAIGLFTAKASHDMKEPLRMIGSFCALLQRQHGHLLDESGLEYLEIIADANDRMNALLAKLLDYTRVGSSAMSQEQVDLMDSVTVATYSMRSALDKREALVEALSLPRVTGESGIWQMLIMELMDNSLKFNQSSKPIIRIEGRQEAGRTIVAVQDNGIGIPKPHRAEVFELFRRLHPRSAYRGSGIGLAIVEKIAHTLGGQCRVNDSPLGGCAIEVELPSA